MALRQPTPWTISVWIYIYDNHTNCKFSITYLGCYHFPNCYYFHKTTNTRFRKWSISNKTAYICLCYACDLKFYNHLVYSNCYCSVAVFKQLATASHIPKIFSECSVCIRVDCTEQREIRHSVPAWRSDKCLWDNLSILFTANKWSVQVDTSVNAEKGSWFQQCHLYVYHSFPSKAFIFI
jgi:hypothetical protein